MKRNVNELLRKAQAPVMVASVLMLPTLLAFGILAPNHMAMLWLLPLTFLAVAECNLLISGKYRVLLTVLGMVLLSGVSVLLAAMSGCWWLLLAAIFYGVALLSVMPVASWSWHEELPPLFLYVGICIFLSGQMLAGLFNEMFPQLQERTSGGVTVSFLVFVALALLSMNRHTLNGAAVRRHKASTKVRRNNGILVMAFFALVTLIVATPAILETLWSFILWIIARIIELIALFQGGSETPTAPTESVVPTQPGDMGLGGEVTLFAEVMKKIFLVVAQIGFVIFVLGFAVFLLLKARRVVRTLKKLMEKWNRILAASTEDYEEEITDIRDNDSVKRTRTRGKRVSAAAERKLPPRERIRFRYGRLLRKHAEWADSNTARENLPHASAELYEKARYSKSELTEQEAKNFISDTKRV